MHFSVAAIGHNWEKAGDVYIPKNGDAIEVQEIVLHTLKLIEDTGAT
jgi:hypothetical protein